MGGVSRYDGKKFVNYGTKDGLPEMFLDAAYVTAKGTLWVGGEGRSGGIAYFDGNRFIGFTSTNGLPTSGANKISGSLDGRTLWFTGGGGS